MPFGGVLNLLKLSVSKSASQLVSQPASQKKQSHLGSQQLNTSPWLKTVTATIQCTAVYYSTLVTAVHCSLMVFHSPVSRSRRLPRGYLTCTCPPPSCAVYCSRLMYTTKCRILDTAVHCSRLQGTADNAVSCSMLVYNKV